MSMEIDYFLTTSSPWTYLGSRIFADMVERTGARVTVYPVNFGEIFSVSGGLPLPKRAPQRQAYRLMELARWKRRRGSTMQIQPANFPSTTPVSSLTIIAAREAGLDALGLSNAVLAALWEDDRNIDDPQVIGAICEACGIDGGLVAAATEDSAIAGLFKSDTELAISRGVFGAPTYAFSDELFWGQDRLDFVAEKLGLG